MIRNRGAAVRALLWLALSIAVALAAQFAIAERDAGTLGALLYAIAAVAGVVGMRRIDRLQTPDNRTTNAASPRIQTTLVATGIAAVGGGLYALAATSAHEVAFGLWLAGLLLVTAGMAVRDRPATVPARRLQPTR